MSEAEHEDTFSAEVGPSNDEGDQHPTVRELTTWEAHLHRLLRRDRRRGWDTSTSAFAQRHNVTRQTLQHHLRNMKHKGHVALLPDGTWEANDLHLASVAERHRVVQAGLKEARAKQRQRRKDLNRAVARYKRRQERHSRAQMLREEESHPTPEPYVTHTRRVISGHEAPTLEPDPGLPLWSPAFPCPALDQALETLGLGDLPDSWDDPSPGCEEP